MIARFAWITLLGLTIALQHDGDTWKERMDSPDDLPPECTPRPATDASGAPRDYTAQEKNKDDMVKQVCSDFGDILKTKNSRLEKIWPGSVRGWAENDTNLDSGHVRKWASLIRGDLTSCNITVSGVIPLATAIYCPKSVNLCSLSHTLTDTDLFSVKDIFKYGVSLKTSVETGIPFLVKGEIEVGGSFDFTRENNWQNTTSVAQIYRFDMDGGQKCAPSTVRLVLRCTAWSSKHHLVFSESRARDGRLRRDPVKGQKCEQYGAYNGLLDSARARSGWRALVEKREAEYGLVYAGDAMDIVSAESLQLWRERWRASSQPSIHRFETGDYVFLCPSESDDNLSSVDIPLRGLDNSALGYIGCL